MGRRCLSGLHFRPCFGSPSICFVRTHMTARDTEKASFVTSHVGRTESGKQERHHREARSLYISTPLSDFLSFNSPEHIPILVAKGQLCALPLTRHSGTIYQRTATMTDETQVADEVPQFSFKKRSNKAKANFRKKPEAPPPASDSDFTSSDDEEGRRIKRRRKNAAVTASSTTNAPRRDEEQPVTATPIPLPSSNDATKHSNWYDDELDAKNLLGNTRAQPTSNAPSASDGTYKGAANYQSFIQKNPDSLAKQFGPIKAPTNIRTVTFMDYTPNVCKDYKQTG